MQRMLKWGLVLAFCLASTVMAAEKRTEFSADMLIIQTTGQTLIEKLYVGKGRARLDRLGQSSENIRVSSLLMDFDKAASEAAQAVTLE